MHRADGTAAVEPQGSWGCCHLPELWGTARGQGKTLGLWPADRPPPLTEHLGGVEQLQQTAPALGLVGGKAPVRVPHAQHLEAEVAGPEPRAHRPTGCGPQPRGRAEGHGQGRAARASVRDGSWPLEPGGAAASISHACQRDRGGRSDAHAPGREACSQAARGHRRSPEGDGVARRPGPGRKQGCSHHPEARPTPWPGQGHRGHTQQGPPGCALELGVSPERRGTCGRGLLPAVTGPGPSACTVASPQPPRRRAAASRHAW